MGTIRRQAPAITAAANSEERAAQIRYIQQRVERIRGAQKQITADVKQLTDDILVLERGAAAAKPPAKPLD